jgi:outer membrane receptor for monomeric catechols
VRGSVSYVKGAHNIKAGITYQHTFLTEGDSFGIVDPGVIPSQLPGCQRQPLPGTPCAVLAPYDLTNGGSAFAFHGHTDIKELGLYVQDTITKGSWNFNLGIRGDLYNGIAYRQAAEPRLGVAYNFKPTNTVLQRFLRADDGNSIQ